MTKSRILGAALLVGAMSAGAAPPAEHPARQPAPQPAEQEPQPERKICRTERATGSLTRRTRICLTQAQWREVHARTKNGIDDFVGDASGGCVAGGNSLCGGP
jgi:hypothetical protein